METHFGSAPSDQLHDQQMASAGDRAPSGELRPNGGVPRMRLSGGLEDLLSAAADHAQSEGCTSPQLIHIAYAFSRLISAASHLDEAGLRSRSIRQLLRREILAGSDSALRLGDEDEARAIGLLFRHAVGLAWHEGELSLSHVAKSLAAADLAHPLLEAIRNSERAGSFKSDSPASASAPHDNDEQSNPAGGVSEWSANASGRAAFPPTRGLAGSRLRRRHATPDQLELDIREYVREANARAETEPSAADVSSSNRSDASMADLMEALAAKVQILAATQERNQSGNSERIRRLEAEVAAIAARIEPVLAAMGSQLWEEPKFIRKESSFRGSSGSGHGVPLPLRLPAARVRRGPHLNFAKRFVCDLPPKQTQPDHYCLELDDDVASAPTISPNAARRLHTLGIATVRSLLENDPVELAEIMDMDDVTPDMITDWQDQAGLMLLVPELDELHARLFVAAGYRSVRKIKAAEPGSVQAAVLKFAISRHGQALLRGAPPPEPAKVNRLVVSASSAASSNAA